MNSQKASDVVPNVYRYLLTLESIFAFLGVLTIIFNPNQYLSTLTRDSINKIDQKTTFIYTQLAGGWLYISFTEAVILRLVDDIYVWKLLCLGILISDSFYTHSLAQALGGWNEWFIISNWTKEDYVVTLTTLPFVTIRLLILFNIGFKDLKHKKNRKIKN